MQNTHKLIKAILKTKRPKRKLPTLTKATREWQVTRYIVQGVKRDTAATNRRPQLIRVVGSLEEATKLADLSAIAQHKNVIVYEEQDTCTRTTKIIYQPGKKATKKAQKPKEILYK
jgi:6-phosphofructokinase